MKKSKSMRIGAVLLALTLITSCFVGATFAKYTSNAVLSNTATVAKWSIEVNDSEIAVAGNDATVTFDLFAAAYDLKANQTVDTTVDAEIKADGNLIAPGCGGSYAMVIENLSEVDATYAIDFAITNASNVPLEFALSNSETAADWKTDINDLDITATDIEMEDGTATVTLYWRWAFGDPANNTTDTALGIAAQTAAPTAVVSATITANQVD